MKTELDRAVLAAWRMGLVTWEPGQPGRYVVGDRDVTPEVNALAHAGALGWPGSW